MKKAVTVSAGTLMLAALATAPAAADDTPGCATHAEYDDITGFMYPSDVDQLVGNDGWFIDTANPDTFARGYRSCWAPGERFVKVWFDSENRLSFRKDVVDV